MEQHARVFNVGKHPLGMDELTQDEKRCLPACHTLMYISNNYLRKSLQDKSISEIKFKLSKDAMYYLQVQENLAITTDDLVANIGGTVGIFLGVSCLTFVSFLKYLVKIMRNIIYS